jgi:hypothetical protein
MCKKHVTIFRNCNHTDNGPPDYEHCGKKTGPTGRNNICGDIESKFHHKDEFCGICRLSQVNGRWTCCRCGQINESTMCSECYHYIQCAGNECYSCQAAPYVVSKAQESAKLTTLRSNLKIEKEEDEVKREEDEDEQQ